MDKFRVRANRLKQKAFDLYLFAINSKDLKNITYVTPRSENDPDEVQRILDKKRAKEIGEYLKKETSVLPNAIVVSLSPSVKIKDTDIYNEVILEFSDKVGKYAYILDGQHRIAGFDYSDGIHYDLPVVALYDADKNTRGRVFADINSKQKRVKNTQLLELYYQIKDLKPDDSEVMDVITELDDDSDSPLKNKIQRLPKQKKKWIKNVALKRALTPIMTGGGQLTKKSVPEKTRILKEYFKAIALVWPEAWEDRKGYTLTKRMGFDIMLSIFERVKTKVDVFHNQNYTKNTFFKILSELKNIEIELPGGGSIPLTWKRGTLSALSNAPGKKMIVNQLKGALTI